MIEFEIQAIGRVDLTRRIDQIKKRMAAIEKQIGLGNMGADFQTTLEREIAKNAKAVIQPTQGVAETQKISDTRELPETQKLPGKTQPVNENDLVNSAKVAEALRQAEKIETPQPDPVDKNSTTEKILTGEDALPEKTKPSRQTPPKIERVEYPDTELAVPNRDEKILTDDYTSEDTELTPIEDMIMQTAFEYGVDPQLVRAIAIAESDMNQDEISPVGAIGVMQLMPETAAALGVNPYNTSENIAGGTIYLKQMLDTFDGNVPLAVAAYNAGPGAVKRYGGIPPYAETQHYVGRVMDMFQ